MDKKFKQVLVFFLLLLPVLGNGQIYFFKSFDVDDGLTQSQVTSIVQDRDGYLWLSTVDGINRFDGFHFKVYTQEQGIAEDFVRALAVDTAGILYAGSYSGDISCLLPGQERFQKIPWAHDSLKAPLKKIYIDKSNRVWIITELGEVGYKLDSLLVPLHTRQKIKFLDLHQVDDQTYLATTTNGLGLYHLKTDSITYLPLSTSGRTPVFSEIFEDSHNHLWIASTNGHIWFHHKSWPLEQWQPVPLPEEYVNPVLAISEYRNGEIWFGTFRQGINIVRYEESTRQFDFRQLTTANGLKSDNIYSLFSDKDGNMWIGLNGGGLQQYRGRTFEFYPGEQYFTSREVWSVYRDSENNLWIGGRRGFSVVPGNNGITDFSRIRKIDQILDNISPEFVMAFQETADGKEIWIGTLRNGLFAYNKKTRTFRKVPVANFKVFPSILDLTIDPDGNLWVATFDSGAFKYTPSTGTWTRYSTKEGLPSNRINSLLVDSQGRIWVGTYDAGIAYIQNDHVVLFNDSLRFPAKYVFDIAEDKKGHIWFATSGKGIVEFTGNEFKQYDRTFGLPGNTAYSIIVTEDNTIWFTLSNGMAQLTMSDSTIIVYTRKDGFLGQEGSQGAVLLDNDGSLWWGTIRGLVHYNPHNRYVIFSIVKPIITAVEKFPEKSRILNNARLPHSQSFIRISFSGIDLNYPNKLKFQYRLLPLSENWSQPSAEKSVLLSQLAPNSYTFQLRTVNAFGLISEPVEFHFQILPPWWRTTWFVVLMIIIGVAVIYGGYSYRISSLESQRIRLEQEVIRRTNDLVLEQQKLKNILDALRESEQKFRALAENTPTGIFIYREDKFVYVNPGAEKITGYSAQELYRMNFWEVVHPDQQEIVKKRGKLRQQGKNVSPRYEIKILRKDGQIRWIDYTATFIIFEGKPAAMGSAMDITERKLTELKLYEAQQQLKQILENIEGFLWQATLFPDDQTVQLHYTHITGNFEKILERSPSEYLNDHSYKFVQMIHPGDRENYFATNQLIRKNQTVVREYRLQKQNGSYCWIYEVITPLINEEGQVVQCSGICIDITQRREIETQLKNSEKSYRDLFDSIPEAIYVQDVDGTFLDVNDGAVKMYGYPKSYFIGKTPAALAYTPKVDLDQTMEAFKKALAGTPQIFEWWGLRSDGTPFPKEVLLTRSQYFGKEVVIAIARDITERKRAEALLQKEKEQLAVTLRSIGDSVISIDTDGKITLTNHAAEKLLNTDASNLLGKKISDVFPLNSEHGDETEAVYRQILHSRDTIEFKSIFQFRSANQTRYLRMSSSPIQLTEHEIIGYVLVFRDITERRRFEEEMLKSQKLESLSVLAGGIAHDFNNILTAILGNISLAKLYTEDHPDIKERLIVAEKATIRAQDLTQQLLTFAKGGTPVKKSTSIVDIIRDSSEFGLRGSNVKVKFDFAEDLPLVNVDSGQISQVIQNLVINADQAMPNGGTITIRAHPVEISANAPLPLPPGKYVKIEVEDEGTGIPKEHLPKIFDPFFTTKQKGSGLGLASAFSIIKKHEGHIEVQSELGKGTTFTIYLPTTDEKQMVSTQKTNGLFCGSGRVLIMDDEKEVRELLHNILNHLGYDSDEAVDGAEAVEKYKAALDAGKPYDLVIMDLTIPGGIGGADAIQMLKKIDPNACAIVSSGYSNDPIMANYSEYGFVACMQKPYNIEVVSEVLKSVSQMKPEQSN